MGSIRPNGSVRSGTVAVDEWAKAHSARLQQLGLERSAAFDDALAQDLAGKTIDRHVFDQWYHTPAVQDYRQWLLGGGPHARTDGVVDHVHRRLATLAVKTAQLQQDAQKAQEDTHKLAVTISDPQTPLEPVARVFAAEVHAQTTGTVRATKRLQDDAEWLDQVAQRLAVSGVGPAALLGWPARRACGSLRDFL